MNSKRAAGVLLHPTSFPGPYGIGDFGTQAYRFVDFLEKTGQTLWQILPLNPTGYGNSPYAAASAFAGNPLLIDPEILAGEELLREEDLNNVPEFPADRVDYDRVSEWKNQLFSRSFERFKARIEGGDKVLKKQIAAFEAENAFWLEDYAFFVAAKKAHAGKSWSEWEEGLSKRENEVLTCWKEKLADEIALQKYIQFLFFRQWLSLKTYANDRHIQIIGDVPIFVAYDSADVWAHPDLFLLDKSNRPIVVSGTPPDDFSETGQYWGNPLYRWESLEKDDYRWWLDRLRQSFKMVDVVRLDHFRGFEAYWEIPVNDEQVATNGKWVKGPGLRFFQKVREKLGNLEFIAEDLGTVTPEVEDLRQKTGFPGMAVLLFAFGNGDEFDPTNPYLPENIGKNTVMYTGNHDTDTAAGWFASLNEAAREKVFDYLDSLEPSQAKPASNHHVATPSQLACRLVALASNSVARQVVVPLQDLLGLGSESRINQPGQAEGNWGWRFQTEALDDVHLYRNLSEITRRSERWPSK
ncbi:MAG: 4-alpha-glucanotransferase [Chloroflexi bacterium]|nr:4-alpha-glucanotransferase [Chloroflexota bacterium]OJV90200.1 MAG: 4-alpha-glucanotransferase [Chloroflexi bacterium 54-19]